MTADMTVPTALPLLTTLRSFMSGNCAAVKGGIGDIFQSNLGTDWLWNEKQVLFYHAPLSKLLCESKVDRGVIPVPKYDWSQEHYLTCPDSDFTVWSVNRNTYDEASAAPYYVLEYLAQLGYYSVTPAYLEAISRNAVRSEQDRQMLDCIREGIVIDGARLYDGLFETKMNSFWRGALQQREFSYPTQFDTNKALLGQQVEELNRLIKNME